MKVKKLRARGIGDFHEEIELPIEELGDAQLICVRGNNGEGKTTFIGCVPGALYGDIPTRGPIVAMANAKDSLIEQVIETDQEYTIRRLINAVRKQVKSEAYLIDAEGKPLNDGKVSTFIAEVAKRFPSERTYMASGFGSQDRGGQFLEISKADRKALFVEMLGLEHLQRLAKAAGDKAQALDAQIACQRAELEQAEKHGANTEHLRGRLAIAEKTKAELTATREVLESEIESARQAHDDWLAKSHKLDKASNKAQAKARQLEAKHQTSVRDLERVQAELSKVSAERARLVQQLGARPELEKTVGAADGAEQELADIEKQITKLRAEETKHHKAIADWQARCAKAQAGVTALLNERDRAIAELRTQVADAKSKLSALETKHKHRVDQARNAVLRCGDKRLAMDKAAEGLADVPCHGDGEYASCPLIQGATEAAGLCDGLRVAEQEALAGEKETQQNTTAIDKAREALDELETRKPDDTTDLDQARQTLAELQAKKPEKLAAAYTSELDTEACHQRQRDAAAAKAKLEALDEAEGRAGQLDDEAGGLREQLKKLRAELATHESAAQDARQDAKAASQLFANYGAAEPMVKSEDAVRRARGAEAQAADSLAGLRVELEAAEKAAEHAEEARGELGGQLADLDDWRHLRQAFGPDGIQALEVDAAGPEVSELINKLLHTCYGSRFSVALETTALKRDGKGTKEIFDLHVIDSEKGWEGSAGQLSGGERVFNGEALGLAVAIYNARRSQIPILDLWRDESVGAVDHDHAPLYLEMLRKALVLGGFNRVFFIAHNPDLWPLADKQILFEGGQCRLVDA